MKRRPGPDAYRWRRVEEVLFRRKDQIGVIVLDWLRGAGRQQVVGNRGPDFVDVSRPECRELYSVDALAQLSRNA